MRHVVTKNITFFKTIGVFKSWKTAYFIMNSCICLNDFYSMSLSTGERQLSSVHSTLEEFKNGGFSLTKHQMLSVRSHYTGGNWKPNNDRSFWNCVWGKRGRKITWLSSVMSSFPKSSIFKLFSPSTLKRTAGVSKFLQFQERFRKAPFSWRISVDSRPNRRNKGVF